MKLTGFLFAAALLGACTQPAAEENYTRHVDPKIGTGGHGHVFVGANVPFGLVQVGPTSIPQTWDWCSGYHASDSTVIGFSHTHLSGTGIGDLFDVTVMPVTGNVTYARGTEDDPTSGLWSYADRTQEIARPGYYSVPLTRYGIRAELTATARVGLHRYTFPASDAAAVVFDLENGGCWDKATDTGFRFSDDSTRIAGWRCSTGWAKNQEVYFVAEFSKPAKGISYLQPGEIDDSKMPRIAARYARVDFDTAEGEQVLVKVALSPVSIEGAKANLAAELPGWDFDATAAAADKAWNDELSKVKIETADETARRIFYTALYHTMIAPSLFCDVNGDYYGSDHAIHRNAGFTNYTTFSLWDTYRAAMPLMTVLHPEKMADIVQTMLHIADEQGRLPVWHLWGNETDCMVGNPGIVAVADAIVKGIGGFDREKAFEAIRKTAMNPDRGNGLRMEYGYIPCEMFNEAVAYDMEYALADGAAARAAEALGKAEDAKYFEERSHSYRNYFDPQTGFMRGRDSKKGWRTPFNAFASTHRADDYCEGNAWQYTWLVPHDVEGLVDLMGGREQFVQMLDSVFVVPPIYDDSYYGFRIHEITEMQVADMGNYAHGNQPAQHMIYLYNYAGAPWKAQYWAREVMDRLYSACPDGYCGDEDNGQTSAWYVFSALGFYSVCPASDEYVVGSPLFRKAVVNLENGNKIVLEAPDNSPENRYIGAVQFDGKSYTYNFLRHSDLVKGAGVRFSMRPDPDYTRGTEPGDAPYSFSRE